MHAHNQHLRTTIKYTRDMSHYQEAGALHTSHPNQNILFIVSHICLLAPTSTNKQFPRRENHKSRIGHDII
jgi:hypothetical protein